MTEKARRPARDPVRTALWIGAGLVFLGVALLLFAPRRASHDAGDAGLALQAAGTVHETTLFFGSQDGTHLVAEEREIASGPGLDEWCAAAIRALAEGPQEGDAVGTLPAGTTLHRVFHDEAEAALYLDFAPSIVTGHPGGSAAEWATLGCIVKTIGANFPEIARVQILVDQQPVESLAGHLDIGSPIEIATWK